MYILNDFVERAQVFLMKTIETFRKFREETLGNALTFFLFLVVINAILSTLVLLAGISTMNLNESFPGVQGTSPSSLFVGTLVGGSLPYLLRVYGSICLSGFSAGEKITSRP